MLTLPQLSYFDQCDSVTREFKHHTVEYTNHQVLAFFFSLITTTEVKHINCPNRFNILRVSAWICDGHGEKIHPSCVRNQPGVSRKLPEPLPWADDAFTSFSTTL